jgi:hypothetical protein
MQIRRQELREESEPNATVVVARERSSGSGHCVNPSWPLIAGCDRQRLQLRFGIRRSR